MKREISPRIYYSAFCSAFLVAMVVLVGSIASRAQTNSTPPESPAAARMRVLNNSLLDLHGQMQVANAGGSGLLRGPAADLIAQRAAALTRLIQDDPHTALTFALSPELLADLAAKFPRSSSQLESHVTLTGPVQHWIADYPGLKASRSIWQMNAGGRSLNLYFGGQEPPNLKSTQLLQARGVLVGSEMAVETSSLVQSGSVSTPTPNLNLLANAKKHEHGQAWPLVAIFVFGSAFSLPGRSSRIRSLHRHPTSLTKRLSIYALVFVFMLSSTPGFAQTSCGTKGVQNTAVLLVNFADIPTTVDAATAYPVFFDSSSGRSLNGFWQEASYDQTSAVGNVFGPFTVGASTSYSCPTIFNQLANDVLAAAIAGGVNLQSYSRIFVVLPNLSCGWAGLTLMGSAGGGCSTITTSAGPVTASLSYLVDTYISSAQYPFSDVRDSAVALVAHEGGHQLGLAHSGTVTQRPTAVLEAPNTLGQITDGGDLWTVMGSNNLGLYQAQQKAEILGWMSSPGNYQTVNGSGTFTLQPLETNPPSALQALKVQRGTSPGYYLWVEYKQPIGQYDSTLANAPYTAAQPYTGAMVTYEDPIYQSSGQIPGHTYLVDFNLTDNYWLTPDLNPGQTWSDAYTNVSLSVASANSSGLTVNVNYGSTPCTVADPTVTASPLNPSILPGSTAAYSVNLSNNDSAGCSSSTFTLDSTQPSSWPTSFSANSVTLSPGQSTSLTMYKTGPSGTAPGTYAVEAKATNTTHSGLGTANITVMAPPSLVVTTSVSAGPFSLRSTIPITATVLNGGNAASGASVTITLTTPTGSVTTQTGTTGSAGTVTWNYKTNARSASGSYNVTTTAVLTSGGKKSASTQTATSDTVSFVVQ